MLVSSLNKCLTHGARLLRLEDRTVLLIRNRVRTMFVLPRLRYRRNLRRLNDVLADTPFADKYWITFGLLLGWARDGRPIPWDFRDADFAYLAHDRELLIEAQQKLAAAGFELLTAWRNNAGEITEFVFYKDKARFEFFEMTEVADGLAYYSYGERQGEWYEMPSTLPKHGLETIEYLDRTWLKPDNHEDQLAAVYGTWQVARPDYDYAVEDCNIVEVTPLRNENLPAMARQEAGEPKSADA